MAVYLHRETESPYRQRKLSFYGPARLADRKKGKKNAEKEEEEEAARKIGDDNGS